MITYLHDNSFDGRLCALSAALADFRTPEDIQPETGRQASLFSHEVHVQTDSDAAAGLLRRIRSDISAEALRHVIYTLLSELPNMEKPLYAYLKEGFIRGPEIDRWHANPDVKTVHETSRKTGSEIHRLKGLLRFRALEDGTLWAPVEPDHQVLYPLAAHFRRRMPEEYGIIHDLRRGIAVSWRDGEIDYINPPDIPTVTADEEAIQQLWQTYFRSSTIQERINTRLQRQSMPIRYWKWLPEIG